MKDNIYSTLSVFTVRKCPDCGGREYQRAIIHAHYTERKNNKTVSYKSGCEDGHHWKCFNCGLVLLHSWIGVEPDRSRQKEEFRVIGLELEKKEFEIKPKKEHKPKSKEKEKEEGEDNKK